MSGLATTPAVQIRVWVGTTRPSVKVTSSAPALSIDTPSETSMPRRFRISLRTAAELVAQLRHELGRDVDQMPLDQARVQPRIALHRRVRQPLQAGRRLGARVAAADHHELQPRGPFGGIVAGVGQVELGDDVVADVGGLGEGLHAEGVLGQARDVEGAGHTAQGQHDVVVRLVDDPVGDGTDDADLGLQVHADRAARDDPGAVLPAAAQGQGDRLRREHAGGDLGQQRQIELIGRTASPG